MHYGARVRSTLAFQAEVADGMKIQWSERVVRNERLKRNASKWKKLPQAYLVSFYGMLGICTMWQVYD